jgi:tRNA threonylcarbamoyladenosine modification (KEOPS) complex  Pcc1 subunit
MIDSIISSNLIIKTKDPKTLKELLELEIQRRNYARSESTIKIDIKKKQIIIDIYSKDIIAYKATVNNYINLLELIKKTYEVDL